MEALDRLREGFSDVARDIKLNLPSVLAASTLTKEQAWGTALASSYASRNAELTVAVLADARSLGISEGVIEDAKAAAVLMAMNNVLYRFRHVVGKEEYAQKPARLRMQRLVQVSSSKADLELFSLAVSAINNCQACVQAHEATVLEHGLSTDHVHEAIRIASVISAAALALEVG